jgi:acetyltransferase-like isoleucine patch superfamily enzyme
MSSTGRRIAWLICDVIMCPALIAFRVERAFLGHDRAFPGWSQLISLFPGTLGVYLRNAFYSRSLKYCERDTWISFGTIFSSSDASIGRKAYIGNYCCLGAVSIEDDVLIASGVSIMNGCRQHGMDSLDIPIREQTGVFEPVTIGEGSWIGEKALIAANVGRHCVVGAGALVLKPLPDYSIAVGSPARIIGDRRDRKKAEPASVNV